MTSLLVSLRDGRTIEEALLQTYGFDVDGLEDAWRAAIGAQPRRASAQPTIQPTPTFVPTIVPVGGFSLPAQVTVTPVPTSSFGGQPTPTPGTGYIPTNLVLVMLALCCAFLFLIGVILLGLVVRSLNRKGGNNVQ